MFARKNDTAIMPITEMASRLMQETYKDYKELLTYDPYIRLETYCKKVHSNYTVMQQWLSENNLQEEIPPPRPRRKKQSLPNDMEKRRPEPSVQEYVCGLPVGDGFVQFSCPEHQVKLPSTLFGITIVLSNGMQLNIHEGCAAEIAVLVERCYKMCNTEG